jgi:3-oxoacyl-[acyl-carrier protein] reductase
MRPEGRELAMSDRFSLAGHTAIVTGASRGIGRGIATTFSGLGANVIVFARSQPALDEIAAQLPAHRTVAVAGDVTSAEDLQHALDTAGERFGRLDILCHCAGIYPLAPIEEIDMEGWRSVIDTNLTSTFLAVKTCMPVMREQDYGRIVLISSITGSRTGYPGLSHYSAAKAGMSGFMRTAALELAPFHITINGIEPGSIRTEGLAGLGEDAIKSMVKHIPIGSLGDDDIAHTAAFLASDAARFITGQTVIVDGGQTLPEFRRGAV